MTIDIILGVCVVYLWYSQHRQLKATVRLAELIKRLACIVTTKEKK